MGEFFYIGMGGIAAQRKMKQVLAEPLKVQSGTGQLPKVDPDQPVVQLRDVHFGYGELTVLSGASLAIHPGEHVAIVGPSGAGKSTIAQLIQRNQPVDPGQLFLAGSDATKLDTAQARSLSATVDQSTFLFTATIRDNLRIAKADASDDELWQVLETANLTAEILAMPAGLDTIVGERGYGLSGGQAQRLAIARALLVGAPLLILDEPTSQVDVAGEAEILAAIDRAAAGRTVLTIAHRPTGRSSRLRSVG